MMKTSVRPKEDANVFNGNKVASFIEGQDTDDHFNLQGDLEIGGIM